MVLLMCDNTITERNVSKNQQKTAQEGIPMRDVEMRYVGSHVEVYTGSGVFLFSADTVREAMEELAG